MSDSSLPRIRLLPLTIGCLSLLFFSKAHEVYTGTSLLLAGEARAQSEPAKEEAAPEKAAKAEIAAEAPSEKGEAKQEAAATEELPEGVTKEKPLEDPAIAKFANYTPVEVELLQGLSARRKQLDEREEEIRMKESLLEATEVRLDRKISEIQTMEGGLKKLLDEYGKHEEGEIRSLVKIYENMKPKDAAQIFDEMEMPILLLVVDKMSERKAAPILALMTPAKAKDLTVELADQRKSRSAITQPIEAAAQ
jgi:flagellar motility protein MotE (MotC chaperone)